MSSGGGMYGSNFEVHWREKSRETPKNESQGKSQALCAGRGSIGDKAVELKDHEEAS
jgi:hypothetical protein